MRGRDTGGDLEDFARMMPVAVSSGKSERAPRDGGVRVRWHDRDRDTFPTGTIDQADLCRVLRREATELDYAVQDLDLVRRSLIPAAEGVADPTYLVVSGG